jgi:hypothetical protein
VLAKVKVNNGWIERVNSRLPSGRSRLSNAEMIARNLNGPTIGGATIPTLVDSLVLPRFYCEGGSKFAWPSCSLPQVMKLTA